MEEYESLFRLIINIHDKSEWGTNLNFEKTIDYLSKELCELIQAISIDKSDDVVEEFCDVIMVVLFSILLIKKEYDLTNIDIINKIKNKLKNRYAHILISEDNVFPEFEEHFYQINKSRDKKEKTMNVRIDKILGEQNKKIIFKIFHDIFIEVAVFYHKSDYHICLSTQAGCHVGCLHCATTYTKPSYIRNLTLDELNDILKLLIKELKLFSKNCILSLSGHGEVLNNYFMIKMFLEHLPFKFKKIYITSVLPKENYIQIENMKYDKLYISLHGSSDNEREKIFGKKYSKLLSVNEIINFINEPYMKNKDIVLNYIMCKHNTGKKSINNIINIDSKLLRCVELRCTKLITVVENMIISQASIKQQQKFNEIINSRCKNIKLRFSIIENDDKTNIACGQLRAQRML